MCWRATGGCGSGGVLLLAPMTAAASFEAAGCWSWQQKQQVQRHSWLRCWQQACFSRAAGAGGGAGPGKRAHYCWQCGGGRSLVDVCAAVRRGSGCWQGRDECVSLCVVHCSAWLSMFGHSSYVYCMCAAVDDLMCSRVPLAFGAARPRFVQLHVLWHTVCFVWQARGIVAGCVCGLCPGLGLQAMLAYVGCVCICCVPVKAAV